MSNQWHGGKGSAPRKSNDQKTYEDNWEKIFGNKDKASETIEVDEKEIDKS
tara:strand:+ start:676 stop:828 length:153 start_codon:yes stop_codon:yes gene_type:complete